MRRLLLVLAASAAACSNQPFTIDVPLRVAATQPSTGATGVARKSPDGSPAPIVISMSEELDPASVTPAAVRLEQLASDGTPGEVATEPPAFSVQEGRFLVTLQPKARLAYSQAYRVTVSTDLRRKRDGGRLPTTVRVPFVTENPPPLAIVFAKPSDGARGVDGETAEFERSPVMRVRFSEPVDCASVTNANVAVVETFDAHPHTAGSSVSRTVSGKWLCNDVAATNPERLEGTECLKDKGADDPLSPCVITFQPSDAIPVFSWSSGLSVTLRGGAAGDKPVQSLRATPIGGQLPSTTVEKAAVVDPPALALVASGPSADATGVARDAAIALHFSEPVDCAQLQAVAKVEEIRDPHPHLAAPQTRTVWPGGGAWTCPDLSQLSKIDHSCGTDGARCTVTFTAAAAGGFRFDHSSTVRVTLPGGGYSSASLLAARGSVESLRATSKGGTLPAASVFTFRVADPPALSLQAASPADGAAAVARDAPLSLSFSEPVDCAQLIANAVVTEVRDSHGHVPAPAQLAQGSAKTRQLWPALGGGTAGGAWECPAAGNPNGAKFVPAADPNGANLGGDDGKPLAYSSLVVVALKGGSYTGGTAPAARVVESARATSWGGTLPADVAVKFRTEDPPPLRLASATPGDASTGIARSQTSLTFRFDQRIDCAANVLASTSVVEQYDPLVAARLGAASSGAIPGVKSACTGNSFTWQPASLPLSWELSSSIAATLTSGAATTIESAIATSRGGQLVSGSPTPVSTSFAVVDPEPLHVVATSPSDASSGVNRTAPVALTFSRAVDASTASRLQIAVSQADVALVSGGTVAGGTVAASSAALTSSTVLTWTPAAAYNKSALVTATATSPSSSTAGVLAADATTRGGWLVLGPIAAGASSRSIAFRAADPGPLSVAYTQPNGGGTGKPDASILVVFDRAVVCTGATSPAVGAGAISAKVVRNDAALWTTSCTGSNASYGGAGTAVLTLTDPDTQPAPLDQVKVTIPSSIAAADATNVSGAGMFGLLPSAADFTWSVSFAPLAILATAPTEGVTAWPNSSPIEVTFSAAVRPQNLIECTTAPLQGQPGTPQACNFQLFDRTANAPVAGVAVTQGTSTAQVVLTPASPLTLTHAYRLTLFGGLYNVSSGGNTITVARLSSTSGTTFLPQDFPLAFTVNNEAVIAGTSPVGGATNVPVGAPICLTFGGTPDLATVTPANVTIRFAAKQGSLVLPWSGLTSTSGNTACLNLTQQSILDGLGGDRTLLYGATYTVSVSNAVNLTPPLSWAGTSFSFTTQATPPQLHATLPASYGNAYVSNKALGSATDVPLDATFSATLATGSWIGSTVASGTTVALVPGTPPFAGPPTPAPTPIALNAAAVSGGTLSVKPAASLAFDTAYTLVLKGGMNGLRISATGGDDWLQDTVLIPFRTSKQTGTLVGPYDSLLGAGAMVPIVFSRPVSLPTATSLAISATVGGVAINGFIGQYAPVPTAVNFIAEPTWPSGSSSTASTVSINGGSTKVLDEVGNPTAAATTSWTGTYNVSALGNSIAPAGVSTGTPACLLTTPAGTTSQAACNGAGTNAVLGDQALVLNFQVASGKLDNRMQPDTFSDTTVVLKAAGASCASANTQIPLAMTFVPGCTRGSGCPASPSALVTTQQADQLVLKPVGGAASGATALRLLNASSGCTYSLQLKQSQFTNLFGLAVPAGDVSYTFQGATATPALGNLNAVSLVPGGATTALSTSGVTTVPSGRVSISADLTATIAGQAGVAATVAPESLGGRVTFSAGFPSGTVKASGSTVTFRPDEGQRFASGQTYAITFKAGIADLAGNALASDVTVQLQAEATAPTLSPANVTYVSKADARFPNGAFKLVFSEPMRAESFTPPTRAAAGTITAGTIAVSLAGQQVLGWITVDGADPRIVWFQPTGPTGAAISTGTYSVTVSAAATDLASNALAGAPVNASVVVSAL